MKIIIVTGPPYSGKGTQCDIIGQLMGFTHLSTGDRCRQEKTDRTAIGLVMSAFEEKGDLVPDSIMKDLFSQILDEHKDERGIILDGYPRTIPQVNDLLQLVAAKKQEISLVININVPAEELLVRAERRAADSDRKDDKDPTIHLKRVRIFGTVTHPAIDYMKTLLPVEDIDGVGGIDEITQRISLRIKMQAS